LGIRPICLTICGQSILYRSRHLDGALVIQSDEYSTL